MILTFMIMEKRKGGMRLTECPNNSFSYSQDKQHHQLNGRTLDDRLHYLRTRQLLGMHVSIRLITTKLVLFTRVVQGDALKRCPGKGQLTIAGQRHVGSKEKEQKRGGSRA